MRRFSTILAATLALIMIGWMSLQTLAQQRSAREFVEGMLEDILAAEGRSVSISGLGVGLDGGISIQRAEIKDGETPWIVIEGLSVAWQPLSLFNKQLTIDEIAVQRMTVERIPKSQDSGVATPKEFTGLTAARVEKLAIASLDLGAAVLGEAARLRVDGSIDIIAEPAEIKFKLLADRIDGKSGKLTADVSLDPQSRNMSVAVSLVEPGDGIVAKALRIRGEPSVDLTLQAQGKLDSWKGSLALKLDNTPAFTGDASAARASDGVIVALSGEGDASRFAPAQLEKLLGGRSQLSASLTYPDRGGALMVDYFRIDQDAFQLAIAGPVDWTGTGSKVDMMLVSKSATDGLSLGAFDSLGELVLTGASVEFSLSGALADPVWKANIKAADLSTAVAGLAGADVMLDGRGLGVAGRAATLSATARGTVRQGGREILPPAVLGAGEITLAARREPTGVIQFSQFDITSGNLAFRSVATLDPATGAFSADLNGSAQSPQTGVAVVDRLLDGNVKLAGQIASANGTDYTVKDFSLTSATGMVTATGDVTTAASSLDLTFEVAELALIDGRLAGRASGAARVAGPRDALRAGLSAHATGLRLAGKPFDDAKITASLLLNQDAPAGQVALSGQLAGQNVTLSADVENGPDGATNLKTFNFASGRTTIAGSLTLPKSASARGAFTVSSPDLSDIGPFLLADMAGSLEANVTLADDAPDGKADITFTAQDLRTPWLSASEASGTVVIAAPLAKPVPDGSVAFNGLRVAGLAFSEARIDAKGQSLSAYDITLATRGDVALDAAMRAEINGNRQTFTLSKLDGTYKSIPFAARQPVVAVRSGEALTLSPAEFAVGEGRVSIGGVLTPKLDATARVQALPLSLLEGLADVPGLSGLIDGEARITGATEKPNIAFNASGRDVTLQALTEQGLDRVTFTADGNAVGSKVTFTARGTAGTGTEFTAQGSASPQALDLAVDGQTNVGFLADRLFQRGIRLEAQSRFAITVSGAPRAAKLAGTISITNATAGDTAGRLIIRNASGTARIADNVLRIERFTGTTGKSGTAALSGTLSLDPGFAANLALRINDGIYTDGSFVVARYDAAVTLTGPLADAPLLGGEIILRKTNITLSSIPKSALAAPDVKHRNPPIPVLRQSRILKERRPDSGGNLRLNVRLRAGNPISVSGRGLNVSLGGQLQLGGSLDALSVQGAFRLVRGSMKFLARTLQFESGRLDFIDGLDPRIDLTAVSRQSDATISLRISGRASTPDISVTSSPQMAEEEALARLVFDRSMLQLSPLQIAQIASYVATLSGGRDTGILTGLQNALGVDWLDVIQTETGETAVSVGKRINDRLSIGVEQTTETNTSRVTIDLGVSKNVKVRGAYGTDGETRAGVFFEKDY